MDLVKRKKLTIFLCILWLAAFILTATCCGIYIIYTMITSRESPVTMLSPYQFFVLGISTLFFYPLLYIIHHNAKIAAMKAIMICARIGLIFFSFWCTVAVITTICYCFNSSAI